MNNIILGYIQILFTHVAQTSRGGVVPVHGCRAVSASVTVRRGSIGTVAPRG